MNFEFSTSADSVWSYIIAFVWPLKAIIIVLWRSNFKKFFVRRMHATRPQTDGRQTLKSIMSHSFILRSKSLFTLNWTLNNAEIILYILVLLFVLHIRWTHPEIQRWVCVRVCVLTMSQDQFNKPDDININSLAHLLGVSFVERYFWSDFDFFCLLFYYSINTI